jgi:hypothetical protein
MKQTQFTPFEASILAHLAQKPDLDQAERKELLGALSSEARKVANQILSGKEQAVSLQQLRKVGSRDVAVGKLKKEQAAARAIRHWVATSSRSS